MIDNTDTVVKCKKCGQYFMHTKKAIKCPFCYTGYNAVEEKVNPPNLHTDDVGKDTKLIKKTFQNQLLYI